MWYSEKQWMTRMDKGTDQAQLERRAEDFSRKGGYPGLLRRIERRHPIRPSIACISIGKALKTMMKTTMSFPFIRHDMKDVTWITTCNLYMKTNEKRQWLEMFDLPMATNYKILSR